MFVEPVTLLPQSVSIAVDTRVGKLQGFKYSLAFWFAYST